jgi:hypothetical protein
MWDSFTFFISGFSWDQKEYLPSADAKLGFHCTSNDVKAINKLHNNFWRLLFLQNIYRLWTERLENGYE